jgi:hypothetical protein
MKIYTIALLAMVIPMTATADAWDRCSQNVVRDITNNAKSSLEYSTKMHGSNLVVEFQKKCGPKPTPKNFSSGQMGVLNSECRRGSTMNANSVCMDSSCGPRERGLSVAGWSHFGTYEKSFIKKASRKCAKINRGG